MLKFFPLLTAGLLGVLLVSQPTFAADEKPLRVLLVTGGCCHDYAAQKDILKKGLEARANVVVTQVHTDDKSTKPPLAILGNPDYAKGYDVVIHDECAAAVSDPETIKGVLAPHRAGIPGVNLHCAMHCYRIGDPKEPTKAGEQRSAWFDYLGIQSSGHGAQAPIALTYTAKDHPVTKGLSDWTTINEELYNNIQITTGKELAKGAQVVKKKKKQADGTELEEEQKTETVVVWTNLYNAKTRVFSTTIGHNNATVEDPRYLDLITRGALWATGKLGDDGKIAPGYAKKK